MLTATPARPRCKGFATCRANCCRHACRTITWQGVTYEATTGTTIFAGLRSVASGTPVTIDFTSNVKGLKKTYQVGIAVVGEDPYAEGQGDSGTLALASGDVTFIKNMCAAVTEKCIVVLVSGRPLMIEEYLPLADAWVQAWLPGTEGAGVADVLFGDVPFTGKLPVTWPKSPTDPVNTGDGDTNYLYAFGHGL